MYEATGDGTTSESEVPSTWYQGDRLRDMLLAFKRNWWIPVGLALAIATLSLIVCMFQTPVYRSTATLYVTSGTESDAQSAYQGSLASQQRVSSYAQLVTSENIIDSALASANIGMSKDDVRSAISATTTPGTVLLVISAEDANPERAALLANSVSRAMSSYVTDLERPSAGGPPLAKLTVVSPAIAEAEPISPRTLRNVLLGGIMGFLLGFVVVLVRMRFDTKIRTEGDLLAGAAVPVLAEVPASNDVDAGGVIDFKHGGSAGAEAYRRLRTSLSFTDVDRPARKLLMTSANQGDGKTTTCLNLASSLVEAGFSVVVVDGDLRRPMVAARAGASGAVGLTDVLRGTASLVDAIQSSRLPGLSVIASGPVPPNPSELLGADRAGELFEQLSETFDFVLIDSPPVLPVSDAQVLARWADGVLVVALSNRTRLPEFKTALARLGSARARLLGTVLNGVSIHSGSYRYGVYESASVDT